MECECNCVMVSGCEQMWQYFRKVKSHASLLSLVNVCLVLSMWRVGTVISTSFCVCLFHVYSVILH